MEKKQVIIVGGIGKTERMNRDAFRVLDGGWFNLCPHCTHRKRPSVGVEKMEKKIVVLGFMDNGTGKHQSNTVYSQKKLIPAITTITGGGTQQIKVLRKWKRET